MKYIRGTGRNPGEERQKSHLYESVDGHSPIRPMCGYGWNRSNGEGFSIFRSPWRSSEVGVCKLCIKRVKAGLPGVEPWFHKTKWM